MGPILRVEFLAVAGDLGAYQDAGHLAARVGRLICPVAARFAANTLG